MDMQRSCMAANHAEWWPAMCTCEGTDQTDIFIFLFNITEIGKQGWQMMPKALYHESTCLIGFCVEMTEMWAGCQGSQRSQVTNSNAEGTLMIAYSSTDMAGH